MKTVNWIHGVSSLRNASMNKCVDYLYRKFEKESKKSYSIMIDQIRGIPMPFLKGITNRYFLYSLHSHRGKGKYYHIHDHANSHISLALPRDARIIVTVHDILMLEQSRANIKSYPFRLLNVPGIRRSDHIIAVSSSMGQSIAERISINPEKVTVINNAIDHSIYKAGMPTWDILEYYGISKSQPYLLFVGSEIPRKNFPSVLKAFKAVSEKMPDLKLVKVGSARSKNYRKASMNTASELAITDKVIFCGFVPEEHLPHFYKGAIALCAPSFYEGGSGMHVLEAMACGCPVLASNIPQSVELIGGSAFLCDPSRLSDIIEQTIEIVENEALRNELAAKGVVCAGQFSWERSYGEHLDLYRKIFS